MTDAQSKQNNLTVPSAIIVAGALIAGAVLLSNKSVPSNTETASENTVPSQQRQPTAGSVDIADVDLEGEPFIGDPNAPVTLAYWGDFQCPFCQQFDLQTLSTLVDQYAQAGKLKIVFKDFQFLGPDSQDAGLVAKAVWDLYSDQYFQWHSLMFETQDGENSGFGNMKSILQLIRDKLPQIDADKVAQKVEQKRGEYQQEQDADKSEGSKFGINGTPGFVIGNQTISGAQPANVFTSIIDAELNKTR